uniref:Uncharacterized protein n=1 Tax=Lepeophtheirus salmonis TaxID=72036 RepID=A0A0K2UJ13_LEPSM
MNASTIPKATVCWVKNRLADGEQP